MQQIVNSLDFQGMGYAFLVSADGTILVHPNKDLVMKKLAEVYPTNTPPHQHRLHRDGAGRQAQHPHLRAHQGAADGEVVHRPVHRQGPGLLDAQ